MALNDYKCPLGCVDSGVEQIDVLTGWVIEQKQWAIDKATELMQKIKEEMEERIKKRSANKPPAPPKKPDPCLEKCKARFEQIEKDVKAGKIKEEDKKQAYVDVIIEEWVNPKLNEKLEDIRSSIIVEGQAAVGWAKDIMDKLAPLMEMPSIDTILTWVSSIISLLKELKGKLQEIIECIPDHISATTGAIDDLKQECGMGEKDPKEDKPIDFSKLKVEFEPITMADFMNGRKFPKLKYKKPTKYSKKSMPPDKCYSKARNKANKDSK